MFFNNFIGLNKRIKSEFLDLKMKVDFLNVIVKKYIFESLGFKSYEVNKLYDYF